MARRVALSAVFGLIFPVALAADAGERAEASWFSSSKSSKSSSSSSFSLSGKLKGTSGAAQACCQICPKAFAQSLLLLELDEHTQDAVYARFHSWHETHRQAGEPAFAEAPPAQQSWRESSAVNDAVASGVPAAGSLLQLDAGGTPLKLAPKPCCSLCAMDFLDSAAGGGPSLLQVDWSFSSLMSSASSSLTSSSASSSAPAGSSKTNLRKDLPPSSCCPICADQLYPPTSALDTSSWLQLSSAGSASFSWFSSSKSSSSTKGVVPGVDGCCKVCPSRMYGIGADAPPFSEPGSRDQLRARAGMQRHPENRRSYS